MELLLGSIVGLISRSSVDHRTLERALRDCSFLTDDGFAIDLARLAIIDLKAVGFRTPWPMPTEGRSGPWTGRL